MSTRAQILVKDSFGSELLFYQHSDGYPDGVLPTLYKFIDKVKAGKIRNNTEQAAGWLIVLSREELLKQNPDNDQCNIYGWKASYIEPSTCIHGDIEWFYIVDLGLKDIQYKELSDFGVVPKDFYNGKFQNQ